MFESQQGDPANERATGSAESKDSSPNFTTEEKKKSGNNGQRKKRHGARNQHRHKILVKWLMETFDLSSSSTASSSTTTSLSDAASRIPFHVLDVAGGKGEVSARLTMCHQQRVVMIDPRPANLCHCYETLVLPKIPNKWQKRLEEQRRQNPNFVQGIIDGRFQQLVTTFETSTLEQNEKLQDAVANASLILGLHADGATEAIVDAALMYQKPFCIVPCCVFPNLFTQRLVEEEQECLQDGTTKKKMVPVRSHDQFCRYLAAKDSRFRVEELPFEGRNIAIWWDGK